MCSNWELKLAESVEKLWGFFNNFVTRQAGGRLVYGDRRRLVFGRPE
jgi:hypothetical protein